MSRVEPLVLLTVAGLAGCGLLATLYPETAFDPEDAARQVGRQVRVHLVVTDASEGDDWWRGSAVPVVAGAISTNSVPWLWFRAPPDGIVAGDEVHGRALVQRDAAGTLLVIDGPVAASVTAHDRPVPVRWADLTRAPEALEGRALLLLARIQDDALASSDGTQTCALSTDAVTLPDPAVRPRDVRLQRADDGPGWRCVLLGPRD